MAQLVFGMSVSLDGYVNHEAFAPGAELFAHFIAQTRGLAGSIYGRGLYEVMRYWDEEQPGWDTPERDFAKAWRAQPKWVVSRSLTSVGPNATLLGDDWEAAIRKLKADLDGRIDVGGPKLAASLGKVRLADECQLHLRGVVLDGDAPFFVEARRCCVWWRWIGLGRSVCG